MTVEALPPGSTLGVIGGGQLGRMLCKAAARLGFETVVLTPDGEPPAGPVAGRIVTAPYDDDGALADLAANCDIVTFEMEALPDVELAAALGLKLRPSVRALQVSADRAEEKAFVRAAGAGTADFVVIDSAADVADGLLKLGIPALLKTRREGYDGKGQAWVHFAGEARPAFAEIGRRPAVLEAKVPFVRELSVIAARNPTGETAMFPLMENRHENGVLRLTRAPAEVDPGTEAAARSIAERLLHSLDYIGVLTVELFALADGALIVNEIAPRVHNSGHWTLDACKTDQFEQHVRAVMGWPLGSTEPVARAEMINLLGDDIDRWQEIVADPDAKLHLYGKHEARPGRKMGHVTRIFPLA